jgi:peptide/nickel transport system ATP-binding protein
MLSVSHLSKSYRGRGWRARPIAAVEDVNFEIARGGSLGIVGESGSGKSTLARMISRLTETTSGSILFDGVDISAVPPSAFVHRVERRKIQHVFQDAGENLTPHLTARAAIADPIRRLVGLSEEEEIRAMVDGLAASVALSADLLSRYPHQLSGGQKARVGIARALASNPDLLILDEPTAALDVSVQAAILKLLHRLRSEFGLAYMFISHDIEVVRLMCENVMIMRLGRVVEHGPTRQIFEDPQSDYGRTLLAAVPRLDEKTVAPGEAKPAKS